MSSYSDLHIRCSHQYYDSGRFYSSRSRVLGCPRISCIPSAARQLAHSSHIWHLRRAEPLISALPGMRRRRVRIRFRSITIATNLITKGALYVERLPSRCPATTPYIKRPSSVAWGTRSLSPLHIYYYIPLSTQWLLTHSVLPSLLLRRRRVCIAPPPALRLDAAVPC